MLGYISVIVTLLLIHGSNFDYIPYINENGYRIFSEHPIICIMQPTDKTIFHKEPTYLYNTIKAIKTWSNQLNFYSGTRNWDFHIIYLKLNQPIKNFCDIFIIYSKSSVDNVIGTTGSGCDDYRCQTTITLFETVKMGNINFLIPSVGMNKAIEHELGHAMGLGHFDNINSYGTIEQSHKSIMYYGINGVQPDPLQTIKVSDIKAIFNLYNGSWGNFNNNSTDKYIIHN